MDKRLKKTAKNLPTAPGVYWFKNRQGEVLYVGKAKSLRGRVRSYFVGSHELEPRIAQLISQIADLEYIICGTETEARMLENNLIKKHQPRYNILLKDDKNFQFIKIDYATEIPQIYTVRKIEDAKKIQTFEKPKVVSKQLKARTPSANRYFGPYTSAAAVKETLRLLRYIFPYCSNKKIGAKPCFYYHLKRCPGICIGKISLTDYNATFKKIEIFLGGELSKTLAELKQEMKKAASLKRFEQAARLRDQIAALQKILEKQRIVSPNRESFDAVALFIAGALAGVTVLQIRSGKLLGRENFLLENTKGASKETALESFLQSYYLQASDVPGEIALDIKISARKELEVLLKNRTNRTVGLTVPVRGRKRKLLKLASANAEDYLHKTSQNLAREQALITKALFELKDKLKLENIPFRMEAFDISNIQGGFPTGSMVVFENGKRKKSDYKRFAVKSITTPNDVAMMEEVLSRRFSHQANLQKDKTWRLPDLILVDGGKAQLNVAQKTLKSKKINIPVIALAKRMEEIYTMWAKTPIKLTPDSLGLHLLQRLRDEAHRFAITYHRKRRSKEMLAR